MANWNSLILTNLGKELNAKINAGLTTLRFNRVALGSGTPTSSTITALSKEEQSFPFDVNPPKVKGRVMTLEFTAHNKDLVKQYTIRELGLFAQDPERGSILFAYMTDNAPDIMPARGTATVVTRKMNLNITTDNTGSVSVTTTGKFITIEDLNAHNTSSSAHADIRQLFKNYLPLTGGTVTGRLYVNDAVFMGTETSQYGNFIETSKAGTMYLASGKSENSNISWFNMDGYFKYPNTAEMCVIKRDEHSNILARAFLLDKDNKTRFPNEVYANEKLLATKEYVDGKKWGSTSITDGAVTPTKLDRPYLPLTGGTLTGTLKVADINGISHDIVSGGGTSGGNLNLGNATKTKSTALCCKNRPVWWDNNSARNLALEEDINTHNSSSSAHADIRQKFNSYLPLTGGTLTGGLNITSGSGNPVHSIRSGGVSTLRNLDVGSAQNTTKVALSCLERPAWYNDTVGSNDLALLKDLNWKKLYSVNRAAFVMPASGTALCDIPSMWKELHITWIWRGDKSTINTVVGYEAYTINIVNEVTGDPIIFVAPGSEGYMTVKNNKLYVIHRGGNNDGAPVLVMWR
ncbi:MAG: hypothetical protein SPK95_04750 [Veillonella caviae]|uniref:hypothetical protein n=1 Tax=Veillonella caviae TaxID=248316 RepID=UPI002A9182C4|nr:hypothetical protein [Veillonella caviae]MDY5715221.1 hypothetical protein [Veillonella caviae]